MKEFNETRNNSDSSSNEYLDIKNELMELQDHSENNKKLCQSISENLQVDVDQTHILDSKISL